MAIKEQNTEKLTTEEVTKLNELRIISSELTFERGQIGIAEDNLKRQLNSLAEKFNDLYMYSVIFIAPTVKTAV